MRLARESVEIIRLDPITRRMKQSGRGWPIAAPRSNKVEPLNRGISQHRPEQSINHQLVDNERINSIDDVISTIIMSSCLTAVSPGEWAKRTGMREMRAAANAEVESRAQRCRSR